MAIWRPRRFGIDVGLIWGSFFGPQPGKQIFWESCSRLHGGILFKGPRGSKNMKSVSGSSVRQEACSKSVLGGARARFEVHLGTHLGSQKHPKWNWNFDEIRAQVLKVIFGHLEASWGRFGVDLGLILGSFFRPQPEKQIFWESCPRLHGGILFKGPRGSKT